MLAVYNPLALAFSVNAAVLYHPGEAVRFPEAGRSKKTPTVDDPKPKAVEILDANP